MDGVQTKSGSAVKVSSAVSPQLSISDCPWAPGLHQDTALVLSEGPGAQAGPQTIPNWKTQRRSLK